MGVTPPTLGTPWYSDQGTMPADCSDDAEGALPQTERFRYAFSSAPPSTIHMTLHDLVSPEICKDDVAYNDKIVTSTGKAVSIVNSIHKEYAGRKITFVADRIVNMASKSLVLLLRPRTEQD